MYYYKSKKKILLVILAVFLFIGCETTNSGQNNSVNKIQKFQKYESTENISNNNNPITKEEKIINIGIMLPLSGKHYLIGRSLLNSAQLALEKTNQKNIEFHIVDTGDVNRLTNNLNYLIKKKVEIVIGPVFTDNVKRVKNIVDQNNLTIISLSNNVDNESKNIYVFGLTARDEINKIIDYSVEKNLKKYSIILPNNYYGEKIKNTINKVQLSRKDFFVNFIYYDPLNPDFYEVSKTVSDYENRKIKLEKRLEELSKINSQSAKEKVKKLEKLDTYGELEFDALIIFAQNINEVIALSSILPYYDVDPKKIQYIGNSTWAKKQVLKEPGLQNSFFSSIDLDSMKHFEEIYKETFKTKPHPLGIFIYDLVGLIAKLNPNDSKFKDQMIRFNEGIVGKAGWFKFHTMGKVIREPLIFQIKNQDFILIN